MILPKEHYADIYEIDEKTAGHAMQLAKKLAKHMTDVLKCDGFNIVQNNHEIAGQTVFHFHMHLIPRYKNAKNNDILIWDHEEFTPEEMAGDQRFFKDVKRLLNNQFLTIVIQRKRNRHIKNIYPFLLS